MFQSSLKNWALIAMLVSGTVLADRYDNEWENISEEETKEENPDLSQQTKDADEMQQASSKQVRRFHEVLDDLLAEFGYDVKLGQLKALKNLSIRRVQVSDALPDTYRTYVEMLVAERIRENSRLTLVSCIPCRSKTSTMVNGRLVITSPTTNMESMKEAANQLGIDYFMDIILVYHTTHMVLALEVFRADNQELQWTRTYNSETIKSRFQKLAIDYQQVEKSRPGEEYNPEYRFLVGVGGGIIPNVNNSTDDNGMVSLLARATEKFDNRKHEFGLQLNTYLRKNAFLGDHTTKSTEDSSAGLIADEKTTSDLEPWTFSLAMYGLYGRHFVGSLESYNEVRHALNVGLGFLAAPAYITASVRMGWDVYFGKRFATNVALVALAPSAVLVESKAVKTKAGVGGEIAISLNY